MFKYLNLNSIAWKKALADKRIYIFFETYIFGWVTLGSLGLIAYCFYHDKDTERLLSNFANSIAILGLPLLWVAAWSYLKKAGKRYDALTQQIAEAKRQTEEAKKQTEMEKKRSEEIANTYLTMTQALEKLQIISVKSGEQLQKFQEALKGKIVVPKDEDE